MPVSSTGGQYQAKTLSVVSLAEISALETENLRNGDVAVFNRAATNAAPVFYALKKDGTTSVSSPGVIYSKNANATPGNAGRWYRLNITVYTP